MSDKRAWFILTDTKLVPATLKNQLWKRETNADLNINTEHLTRKKNLPRRAQQTKQLRGRHWLEVKNVDPSWQKNKPKDLSFHNLVHFFETFFILKNSLYRARWKRYWGAMLLIPASGALNFSHLDSFSSLSDGGGTKRLAPPPGCLSRCCRL